LRPIKNYKDLEQLASTPSPHVTTTMLRPYRCVTLTIVATARPFVNTFQVEIEERKQGEKSSFLTFFIPDETSAPI
jgi:hypothetical protein